MVEEQPLKVIWLLHNYIWTVYLGKFVLSFPVDILDFNWKFFLHLFIIFYLVFLYVCLYIQIAVFYSKIFTVKITKIVLPILLSPTVYKNNHFATAFLGGMKNLNCSSKLRSSQKLCVLNESGLLIELHFINNWALHKNLWTAPLWGVVER